MSHLRNYHNGRTCYGHAVTAYAYTFASNWDESGDACEFRLVILAGRPHRESRNAWQLGDKPDPFRPGLAGPIRVQPAYGSPAANWRLARPGAARPMSVGTNSSRRAGITSSASWACARCISIGGGSASSRRGRASAAGCPGSAASESRQRHMNCPERNIFSRRGHLEPVAARTGGPHGLFRGRTTAGMRTRAPTCRPKSTRPSRLVTTRDSTRRLRTRAPSCRPKSSLPTRRRTPGLRTCLRTPGPASPRRPGRPTPRAMPGQPNRRRRS